MIGQRCHFAFSKYPRVLRSGSQRIVACTGKYVTQDDEWTVIEVDSVVIHVDDEYGQSRGEQAYETHLEVKTDAIISVQRYG